MVIKYMMIHFVAFLSVFFVSTANAADALDTICATIGGDQVQSADYTPGIDAYGNAVASADLPQAGGVQLPEAIEIPMTVDMAQMLGVYLPSGADLPASFGTFAVFTDGKVTYQGRDLTDNAKAVCHNVEIGMSARQEEVETPTPQPDVMPVQQTLPTEIAPAELLQNNVLGEAPRQTPTDTIFSGEFE